MKVKSSLGRRGTQTERRKLEQKKLTPTKQRTSNSIRGFSELKRTLGLGNIAILSSLCNISIYNNNNNQYRKHFHMSIIS